jgi:hypothetical protein
LLCTIQQYKHDHFLDAINRLIVTIEKEFVLREVETEFLNIIYTSASPQGRATAQAVSCRPLTSAAPIEPGPVHVRFVVDKVASGQVSL